jgi:hypothetical protein
VRGATALALAAVGCAASAQVPDVSFFAELLPTATFRQDARPRLTWYDLDGRPSLVGLRLVLESGNRVYVAQRLQRIEGSGDPDTVDEYYIESRGSWRVGKQALPFGRRLLLRENALAARLDTELVLDELPVAVAYCDAGAGRNRGIVGRVGRALGASFAVGNHFGIQQTSFTTLRRPESAPGRGRGHRLALGADIGLPFGSTFVVAEFVALRDGETAADTDQDVSLLRVDIGGDGKLQAGWARNWSDAGDVYILAMRIPMRDKLVLEPQVRLGRGGLGAFSATLRVRL